MAFSLPPEKKDKKYDVGKLALKVFPSLLHLGKSSHQKFPHYLSGSLHLTHSTEPDFLSHLLVLHSVGK